MVQRGRKAPFAFVDVDVGMVASPARHVAITQAVR